MSEVTSTHKDDAEDDANQLTCTVCYYPLNHELYEIKRIPGLGVASCVVCFEKLKRAKAFKVKKATETRMQALLAPPGNEDTCSWCRRDDQGTLLLCGNENTCHHQFCETCVANNLGEAELAKFTADDNWCCFVCDPTPLAGLQQQCERLQSESCYSALAEVESDEEMEARVMFHILEQIVKEINEKSIECDRIIEKCDEEFGDENVRMPVRLVEKENLRDLWAHHFLVLETQESLLCDALKDLGYSGEVALLHKSIIDEQETSLVYSQEKFSRFQANDSLNQVPWREDTRTIRKPQSSDDMLHFDESESDSSENDESSTALAQLTSLAEQDPVVMQYEDEQDVNPAELPKEFSRKVPLVVLKALCHVGNDEREELIEKYGIPRHIAIVMAYADLTFPPRINDWSIRNKLHPKVLQALYYAITPPEVAILGNRYHLSADLTGVIDFDDEDDDFSSADDAPKPRINKLNEDVKDPKRRRRELPAQQRREAYEMESKADRTYVQRVRKSAMKDFKQKKSKLARGLLNSLKRLRSCPRQPRVSSKKNGTSLVERTPAITDDSSDSDELEQESHSSDSASDGSVDEMTRKTVEKETISDSSDSDDEEGEEVVDSVFSSFPSVRKFAHNYLRKKSKVQRSRPTSIRRSSQSSTTAASTRPTIAKSQRSDSRQEKDGTNFVGKSQAKEAKKSQSQSQFIAACFQDYIDLTLEDDDDSFIDEVDMRTKGSGGKQMSARSFFKPNGKTASIQLSEESLTAREIEIKRQAAINAFRYFPSANGLVINEKRPAEDEAITMVDQFAALLQPHQVEGIRFLWENTMKSITDARQPDSKETYGCVLAHCMGLGKTFTVIAFLATLMANPTLRGVVDPDLSLHTEDAGFSPERPKPLIHRVLVIVPKNVLHNWAKEVNKWTPKELLPLLNITTVDSTNTSKSDKHSKRLQQIHDWYVKGGILVVSYEMFRSLVIGDMRDSTLSASDRQLRLEKAQKYLVNPGPDLVVADEAHIIKNDRTKINEAVSALRTKRRIALTGTPLQNHLEEYWCMVEWVKKRFLYSRKEFMKLFIRPIREGEAKDAPLSCVQNMKKRSHALHKRLTPIVHRKDQSELSKMISKREFIITVRMTGFQSYLYKLYLSKLKRSGTTFLFRCFQTMMRISNHPVNIALHAATWIQDDISKNAIRTHSGSSKLSLKEAARQLTPIHDHFKNQGKEALQKLEQAADRNEQGLLRETSKPSSKMASRRSLKAKKRKAKGIARRRLKKLEDHIDLVDEDDILFDDDDDDDDEDFVDEDDDNIQGDSSDDGYGEDDVDEEDDLDADLEDFVVDDDVIEYNSDDSASDLLESKLRKRKTNKSLKNTSKRIRLDDLSSESTAVVLDDTDDDDDDDGDGDDNSVEEVPVSKSPTNHKTTDNNTETKKSPLSKDTQEQEAATTKGPEVAMDEDDFGEDGYFKLEPTWAPRAAVNDAVPPKEESPVATTVPISVEVVAPSPPTKPATASPTANEEAPVASSTEPVIPIVGDGVPENELTEDEVPDELGLHWWKEIGADSTESTEPLSARDLLRLSNKMIIVLSLLARTVLEGEKMIIFSQSLYTLDVIEKFLSLRKWGELVGNNFENDAHRFSMWSKNEEYLRIDGSISNRQSLIDKFNDPVKGARTHLMLISTKAGNMGINLQAANRLVLFDCSWNPMHDLQAIYRAYRVGQHRDVFIYRLVSSGTMEEKIYKKQVSKMARANRVVDAQMPSNAFTEKEKSELLEFDEEESPDIDDNEDVVDGNAPAAPTKRSKALQQLMDALQEGTQDKVLMQFLEEYGTSLFKSIENHDSFLVDDSAQHLNSEEKESAELELQRELDSLRGVVRPSTSSYAAAAAPSQPPPPPPPAVVRPTTVAPAATRVTKVVVNTRPAAPPVAAAPRPTAPTGEYTDQQMQILVATVSLLPADTYFERVAMSMNVLFGYRNGVNAIAADEYRRLFQRMTQQGKVGEYITNPNFHNFREQVRLAYLRRGITL